MPTRIILVVGPTASGKSALSIALAQALGGEIVSADAMAVYRGMDIGTAKPTAAELEAAPHHLISCLEPEERCDVSRWLALAEAAITDIRARGRTVIVAGGSPLYTKALLEGLSAGAPRDPGVRDAIGARYDADPAAVFAELQRVDPAYASQRHANDRLRVVRALEVWQLTGQPYSSFHTTDGIRRPDLQSLILGLHWERPILHQRINRRVRGMFAAGLVEEVRRMRPRLSPEAMQAVGYKEILGLLDGSHDEERAIYLVARNSRHLAKHQLTWYRRWRDIIWLPGDAADLSQRAIALADTWRRAE